MRAITYTAFGPAADVLTLEDLPTPDPAAGEVLVRLQTSGVNPSDIRARAGGRPGVTKPPFPKIIPHSDGAGVIEAVGEGVSPDRIGQRVWIWNGQWQRAFGTAADYIALPAAQAVPLPQNVSFAEGATLGIPGLTAVHAVLGQGPVSGKRVLVSGGAGSVGHLAVQVAAASGAEVIATARGQEATQSVRDAGAAHVFDYADPDLAAQILEATGGRPIDHIAEVEFGKNAATIAEVIAENGTVSTYGSAKDMTPVIPFYPLMFKAVNIKLVLVYLLTPEEREKTTDQLNDLLARNALNIRISDTLALDQCAIAHDMIARGDRAGSVILTL
ncbi:NADPH:quinone reductase-like Zn-dependent oxidoreductase [Loktanella sp. PT4BL]|jgi:NADPH2:quinone reductase|uniref:NADPH:quinone reductase n=1 Tax=Loktanella sp. PT4BL TaxID=2135611 RepID=UPI000D7542C8|nr:NADPH:quinone reductase [Loktanella sp. PT4BL]PXW72111.1 NADPH:quinone reductase-like Zn-dependent oxidoreductase [Loktanella sp. PT4BL]